MVRFTVEVVLPSSDFSPARKPLMFIGTFSQTNTRPPPVKKALVKATTSELFGPPASEMLDENVLMQISTAAVLTQGSWAPTPCRCASCHRTHALAAMQEIPPGQ